jgi:D-aspartate ligase
MKRVLIIDGSDAYSFSMARSLSYCKNYELHLIELPTEEHLPKLKYVHRHIIDNYEDADNWIKHIEAIVKQYDIDLTIAGGEKAIKFLMEHQERLSVFAKLPELPSQEHFDIANDKARLSEFIFDNKLSQPKTFIYRKDADLSGLSDLQFPVLIKLPSGEGGKGIERFEDLTELQEHLSSHDFDEDLLCQEFIEGHDICISVICKDGDITAHTIQQCLIENPKLYAPSLSVEFVHNKNVIKEASQLLKLLNWQGVAHIDMRLNEQTGDVYVIEINPRFWESLMASLYAGVNFTWLYCQQMLNLSAECYDYKNIQFIRIKTLFESIMGKHKLLSPCRLRWLRTGVTYRFYGLRRWLSIRS